jgi:hypothetical protein
MGTEKSGSAADHSSHESSPETAQAGELAPALDSVSQLLAGPAYSGQLCGEDRARARQDIEVLHSFMRSYAHLQSRPEASLSHVGALIGVSGMLPRQWFRIPGSAIERFGQKYVM